MANSWKIENIEIEECRLRSTVAGVLRETLGRPVKVCTLRYQPSPYATLFPVHILRVGVQTGEEFSLFMKSMGHEGSNHPDKQCRDREVRVYEELLGDDDLPVAKYYGSSWNQIPMRYELFLENIDGYNLKLCSLEDWFLAASRLAHLHSYFSTQTERLADCNFLLRFDAAYLRSWANRAVNVVRGQSEELADRLQQVVGNYGGVLEVIGRQP